MWKKMFSNMLCNIQGYNQATPNPRAFSNALFNFSSNTLLDEYSGSRSRPKQVKLVGRR